VSTPAQTLSPTVSLPPTRARLGWSSLSDASLVGFLILTGALPYANTLLNDFIYTYDDGTQILKNPYVHSFRYLRQIFATNVWSYLSRNTMTNYYRPAMTFGYLLCYRLFGPLAYGYHLASVVLHAAVVSLVFFVTRRITSNRGLAFGAAALFALHPIHTEAVDWISSVTELELALFFLATFWFFLEAARPGGACSEPAKLGMVICYVMALLSKEQALMLPVLAAVYEHFFRDDRSETTWRQKFSRHGVLWLLALAYALFRIHLFGGFAPLLQRPRLSWPETLLGAVALWGQYVWKMLWPARLCVYYEFPPNVWVLAPWMVAGSAALVLYAFVFVICWKRSRFIAFALVWLAATLAPVLNARWMASNVFGERYLYLPSVGFCWVIAWSWMRAWQIATPGKAVWRGILVGMAGVVAVLSVVRIATRNSDWHDDVTLYTRTLKVLPDSHRVMNALGLAYWERGNIDAAEQEWRRLLVLSPYSETTWNYLGVVLAQKKQYAEALRCFQRSLALDPAAPDTHLNLGAAYAEQGLMQEAEIQFRAVVALAPLYVHAHNVLGKLYFDQGRLSEAQEQFSQSIAMEPNIAAYDHLGYIFLRWGDRDQAERAFQAALSLNPADSSAHFSLGSIYAASGRREQAIREYLAGLESDPQDTGALEALEKLRNQATGSHSSKP
jgi:protein O-mannosyl-transferase